MNCPAACILYFMSLIVQLMTWEGLTDGLNAYLNTFMSYLPQTMVVGRRLLLRAHLC
jgi:hypothetical protein